MEVFNYLISELNLIAKKQGSTRQLRGVTFQSADAKGDPIYHTDVMMTLLSKHAVVCLDAVTTPEDRARLVEEITSPELNIEPHEILELSLAESGNMCSNMFDIMDKGNNHCIVMSERAEAAFQDSNLKTLKENYKVIVSDLDIIETIGGGSSRCLLVELF